MPAPRRFIAALCYMGGSAFMLKAWFLSVETEVYASMTVALLWFILAELQDSRL